MDLFGDGFVLLRFGEAETSGLADAATARGIPLKTIDISQADVAALYGGALVLVRPDGHVAWRSDQAPADPGAVLDCVRGADPA